MPLPDLGPEDVVAAVPGVDGAEIPIRGGQKLVFPVLIAGQRYALKVMLAQTGNPDDEDSAAVIDEVVARAEREVEVMSNVENVHLVRVGPLSLTKANIRGQEVIYFAEEWVEGRDLGMLLQQRGPLSIQELIRLGSHVTEAIKALWSLAKIHRDIKPKNVMQRVWTGDFVLLDMGLVFDVVDDSLTALGFVVGTVPYFSPEQTDYSKRRQLDFRSDIFSLGVVLYEAATGRNPFDVPGGHRIVFEQIRTFAPPAPSAIRPEVPKGLEDIIMRMLAKSPHLRYRTCDQLLAALRLVAESAAR